MSLEYKIDNLIESNRRNNTPPLAIHTSGTETFIICGATTITGTTTVYPILRMTEVTVDHVYYDYGSLLESVRVTGAGGAPVSTDLKTDQVNTLLLMATLTFG